MYNIYVASLDSHGEKTSICVGLGRLLWEKGYNIGYMKPIGGHLVNIDGAFVDVDTRDAKEVFGLPNGYDDITPILLTETVLADILKGKKKNYGEKIKKSFEKIKEGKDILLIEGFEDIWTGLTIGLSPSTLAELTKSKILISVSYSTFVVGRILEYNTVIEQEKLIGAVISGVPQGKVDSVRDLEIPYLESKGVKMLGFLPKSEFLKATTSIELAQELGGAIICGKEYSNEPIHNFIVGAMSYENALKYFRRIGDKAVITGGDRAEIQLAALETPTKALVLTGNLYPGPAIMAKAEERGIPIIVVPDDTLTVVEKVENLMDTVRLKDERKIEEIKQLIVDNIDLDKLYGEADIK